MMALQRDGFAGLTLSDLLLPHMSVCKVFPQITVLLVGNGDSGFGFFSAAFEMWRMVTE
jgi:hypothetical protein